MNVTLPLDKSRRKRLKVVSACSECRRKKTKCNGESPCNSCIKANVECKYVTSQKIRSSNTSTTLFSNTNTDTPLRPMSSSPILENKTKVEAIEERLVVIEDILRALLKGGSGSSGNGTSGGSGRRGTGSSSSNSRTQLPVYESGASCGYHPPNLHAPRAQNWQFARDPIAPTPRRPTTPLSPYTAPSAATAISSSSSPSAFHLPPLTSSSSICSLSSSSSTSTTSSGGNIGPSIRNLLNDDIVDPVTPTHQHHKEGRASDHYYRGQNAAPSPFYYHPSSYMSRTSS
ncbi:hypothetical protein BX666DRAFT_523742 [Dichotomocladium elegans]|nr:hypothetical protein BX666DRAFT_523742 [Dichotomocladium elegans]